MIGRNRFEFGSVVLPDSAGELSPQQSAYFDYPLRQGLPAWGRAQYYTVAAFCTAVVLWVAPGMVALVQGAQCLPAGPSVQPFLPVLPNHPIRPPEAPAGSQILTFCYDTGERYISIEALFA